jgi:hypothetical protein
MRRLSDYEFLTNNLLGLVAQETFLHSDRPLDEVLEENKRLVVVFNHSSPLSWIPGPCLLTAHLCARGGGYRKPIAVMDRFFYSVPILRMLAKFVTQSDRALKFHELVAHFERLDDADLVVFPEGSNCFFGPPDQIQPFRSNRFVEIAMRTQTPLLICVHRGSEEWGLSLGRLTIPVLPRPMKRFSMLVRLYRPEFQGEITREEVDTQADLVHKTMQKMLQELDELVGSV